MAEFAELARRGARYKDRLTEIQLQMKSAHGESDERIFCSPDSRRNSRLARRQSRIVITQREWNKFSAASFVSNEYARIFFPSLELSIFPLVPLSSPLPSHSSSPALRFLREKDAEHAVDREHLDFPLARRNSARRGLCVKSADARSPCPPRFPLIS